MPERVIRTLLLLLTALIAGAIALLAVAMSGVAPELTHEVDRYISLDAAPDHEPPPAASGPGGRIVIPAADVDAPIVDLGMDANGVMQSPGGAWEVAWYDFSALPGDPGNTVMAGHVDYHDVGPAVFWRLRDLGPGDRVDVHLVNGGVVSYRVTDVASYPAATAPFDAIVGPTPDDVLTLITCDGGFDPAAGQYDRRLVVRATRV